MSNKWVVQWQPRNSEVICTSSLFNDIDKLEAYLVLLRKTNVYRYDIYSCTLKVSAGPDLFKEKKDEDLLGST